MATGNGHGPGAEAFRFDEFWREWQANDPEGGIEVPPKSITLLLVVRDAAGNPLRGLDGAPLREEVSYPLPATLPAITVLRLLRHPVRSHKEYLETGLSLFGEEALERWARDGKSIAEVASIVEVAEAIIRGSTNEQIMDSARERGKRRAPKKKTLTSSGIGS